MRSGYGGPDREEVIRMKKARIELPSFNELWPLKWSMLRAAVVGLWLGILPGVGATTAAIVGYAQAVRFSKHPERFGKGEMEGVMAAETANNAATGGAMIPLLALGIPGSATTAIMIGAFLLHGLRPGPLFLVQQRPLAFTIFAGMALSQLVFLVLGFFAVKPFARVAAASLSVPGRQHSRLLRGRGCRDGRLLRHAVDAAVRAARVHPGEIWLLGGSNGAGTGAGADS